MSGVRIVGGKSDAQPISSQTHSLVQEMKTHILSKANLSSSHSVFEPVSERKQVVAGINHFVKIHIGDDKYIHATIWQKPDQSKEVTHVRTDKSKDDEL